MSIINDKEQAKPGEQQADNYLTKINVLFDGLTKHPKMGVLRRPLGHDLRSFSIGSHTVIYQVFQGKLLIERVLNRHMDVEKH